MIFKSEFRATDLWQGCLLATISHAIFTAIHPELANEQSWDGSNYNVQDSQGSLGTISFAEDVTVGAFFDSSSARNPVNSGEDYSVSSRLVEMPARERSIAERDTLQYMLQDYKGRVQPMITAVFWSEGGLLVAAEPWEQVFTNGAHLIQTQLQSADRAIETWREHYGFSSEAIELIEVILSRKMAANGATISVDWREVSLVAREAPERIDKSREMLAEIGILLLP